MKKLKNDYNQIFKEIKKGNSLTKVCKERHICIKNTRMQLKKKFQEEYNDIIYGKIIGKYQSYLLRKIPDRQTNRTECDITKKAKEILKKEYDCIEEVGVWFNNYRKRYSIDLYSIKNKVGIELYWESRENFKKLSKKLNIYKKLFGKVICALLKDSSWENKNRSYPYISKKLRKEGFDVLIVDISKTPTPYELP